jgi:benzoate-CoA ligase family protein
MSETKKTQPTVTELVRTVNFNLPEIYNASRLLWDNLDDNAQRIAVIADSDTWTYQRLIKEAAQIGNHLLQSGCVPGDRVLLFMDDEPAYPAAIMGAMRAGLVPMLINTLSTPDLVRFYLEDSDATAAVISAPYNELFSIGQIKGTSCQTLVTARQSPPWAQASTDLPEARTTRADMAFWMYSSGSTGRPKGVVHKHEDAAYTAATYARSVLNIGPEDICFSVPKVFFAYGFGNSVTFPMVVGAAAVLMAGRPIPEDIFDQIKRHRPTLFFGLPTLYTALTRHKAAKDADLSSIRLCLSAAEILSADIAGAWKDQFGHSIIEGLGSTEMLHIYLSNDQGQQKTGSAGQAVPGYTIRLVAPDGTEALPGSEGVMHVRGLSGATYYWNRPDKTAETMLDGWLNTDDRFTCDQDGFYYFKGRANDLVKVSGQWVYPMEIELALNEHEAVQESCVLAIEMSDQRLTLKAWISTVAAQSANDELVRRLKDYCKSILLPHKYPREIKFVDSLPKTGTGKIDRQALRATTDRIKSQ